MNAMTYSEFRASGKPGCYDPDTDAYYSDDDYRALVSARNAALADNAMPCDRAVTLELKQTAQAEPVNDPVINQSKRAKSYDRKNTS